MINAKINFNNINKETKNEIINNLISNFNKLLDKELKETLNQNEFIIFKLDDFIYDNNNTFWFILFYYEKLKEYEFKQKNLFKLIITEENDNNLINLKILLKMESIGYIFITQNFTNNFDLFFKNLFNFNNNYQIEFINFKV
ncbi:MAG: hypothetical protein ACP5O4_06900 [bacterium]